MSQIQMKLVTLTPSDQAVLDNNMMRRESGYEEMTELKTQLWIHNTALDFYSNCILKNIRIHELSRKYAQHKRYRGKCISRLNTVKKHYDLWNQTL